MKRIVLVLLVVFGIILIAGCGKDKETTAPDFSDAGFFLSGDYTLMLSTSHWGHDYYEQGLSLIAKYPVYSIKVNGNEIELDGSGISYQGYYITFSDNFFPEDDFFILPGKVCDYSFVMNGKSYSGSITAVNIPTISYSSFRFDENYNLSWSISKNPSSFLIDYVFSDYWENDDNFYEDFVQLKGDTRSYSISKSGWQHMDEDYLSYYIDFSTINYKKKSNSLALSVYSVSSDDYEDWKAAPSPRPNLSNRQRADKLFKQIQQGKLVLD